MWLEILGKINADARDMSEEDIIQLVKGNIVKAGRLRSGKIYQDPALFKGGKKGRRKHTRKRRGGAGYTGCKTNKRLFAAMGILAASLTRSGLLLNCMYGSLFGKLGSAVGTIMNQRIEALIEGMTAAVKSGDADTANAVWNAFSRFFDILGADRVATWASGADRSTFLMVAAAPLRTFCSALDYVLKEVPEAEEALDTTVNEVQANGVGGILGGVEEVIARGEEEERGRGRGIWTTFKS